MSSGLLSAHVGAGVSWCLLVVTLITPVWFRTVFTREPGVYLCSCMLSVCLSTWTSLYETRSSRPTSDQVYDSCSFCFCHTPVHDFVYGCVSAFVVNYTDALNDGDAMIRNEGTPIQDSEEVKIM